MTTTADVSVHSAEDIPPAPDGWIGGDLVHQGGNIYVREWIHPDARLRVGYSVSDPESVAVEAVELADGHDETSPLNWQFVETHEERACDGEEACLETALSLLTAYPE